jgi:iron complex outermembrane receptor protein
MILRSRARYRCALTNLAALVVILSTSFVVSAQTPETGTIIGVVDARETGQPVAGAAIKTEDGRNATTTSALGRFQLDGLPVGVTVLTVEAAGFLPFRVTGIQVQPNAPTELTVDLEATPNIMQRVQVTATKEPLSVGDVAAQTDIVDRVTIENRGEQTLVQAINHVPGAVVSTQLGIFESVMLRGLPRGDPEFTNTLLLIDGVPQTLSNNGARVVAMPINDASSIEIVRGPNSALYGRTAIGGAVNMRTSDPTPDHQFGFDFTGGQFGMLKGVGKASGPVKQWGSYYVSAASERNHGYFKATSDFLDANSAQFAKLVFAPDPKSFGSVSVNRVVSDNSTPTNEPIIDGHFLHELDPRFDRFTSFNIPGPNYHQAEGRVTLNYTRQLASWARFSEVFGYRNVEHHFIIDGDFIAGPFDLDAHTVTMYPFDQKLNENIYYQEARVELTPRSAALKHSLIAGSSYEWNKGRLASDFIDNDPDLGGFTINYLNPVIPPKDEWNHSESSRRYHLGITGVFGQYMIQPVRRLILTAGGRYDRLNLDNTRLGSPKVEATFDAFSPKGSATFKLLGAGNDGGPTLNLYGTYSESFLPPRRPSSLIPADVPLNLKPEDIHNYEGGLKAGLLGGRIALEATYFRMRENGVVLSRRQGPFFLPTNAGQLRYKGVETGASWAATRKISVYANSSFYRNRFGNFVIQSEDGDDVLTGNLLPISPKYVVNWGATFTPTTPVNFTVNVKHLSSVQTNTENTFALPRYSVADAAVSWRRGSLRITVSAHNIFDETYYWNGDGETADPGRPRQVLVGVSMLFR